MIKGHYGNQILTLNFSNTQKEKLFSSVPMLGYIGSNVGHLIHSNYLI